MCLNCAVEPVNCAVGPQEHLLLINGYLIQLISGGMGVGILEKG